MHLFRFWSLLFICINALNLAAQHPSIELNWDFKEGGDQYFEGWIKAQKLDSNYYYLEGAEILSLRLSEGRLKQKLDYHYDSKRLAFKLPAEADDRARVYLEYKIPWEHLERSAFVSLLEPGLVLNALNMESNQGSGKLGLVFPAPADASKQWLRLNIATADDLNIEAPLDLEFQAVEGSNLVRFYRSEEPLSMQDFYLAIGSFRRFDPEEVLADLKSQELALEDQRIENFQSKHHDLLNYIAREKDYMFTREGLLGLSEIEAATMAPIFPSLGSLDAELYQQRISLAILQEFYPDEWQFHWANWNRKALDAEKWEALLKDQYEKQDSSFLFWRFYLEDYLAQYQLAWTDTLGMQRGSDSLRLAKAKYFLKRRKSMPVQLNYRMNFREARMELYLKHRDTTQNLILEWQGEAYLKNDTLLFKRINSLKAKDTLFIAVPESPRAVYLNPDPYQLVFLAEERPLNFLLFDLSQRNKPQLRRRAMLNLLENAKPSLKATVIGLALDSEEKELQHLALDKVNELKPDGRARLQSTLEALAAQNEDVKLKQKAAALLRSEP